MKKERETPRVISDFVSVRDGSKCRYCGSTTGPFSPNHVYPVSKGGETSIDNILIACEQCILEKQVQVGIWPMTKTEVAKVAGLDKTLETERRNLEFLKYNFAIYLIISVMVWIFQPSPFPNVEIGVRVFWIFYTLYMGLLILKRFQ